MFDIRTIIFAAVIVAVAVGSFVETVSEKASKRIRDWNNR